MERKPEDIIKLNVGGTPFYTTYATLKPSKYFRRLLAADNTLVYVNKDEIFIDRTASLFTEIMDYLRNDGIHYDEIDDLESLKKEAEFYRLYELADSIEDTVRLSSAKQARTYELIDYADLKEISAITQEGTKESISDKYEIISTYSYAGMHFECSKHGIFANCPTECTIYYVQKSDDAVEKLLVAKIID